MLGDVGFTISFPSLPLFLDLPFFFSVWMNITKYMYVCVSVCLCVCLSVREREKESVYVIVCKKEKERTVNAGTGDTARIDYFSVNVFSCGQGLNWSGARCNSIAGREWSSEVEGGGGGGCSDGFLGASRRILNPPSPVYIERLVRLLIYEGVAIWWTFDLIPSRESPACSLIHRR